MHALAVWQQYLAATLADRLGRCCLSGCRSVDQYFVRQVVLTTKAGEVLVRFVIQNTHRTSELKNLIARGTLTRNSNGESADEHSVAITKKTSAITRWRPSVSHDSQLAIGLFPLQRAGGDHRRARTRNCICGVAAVFDASPYSVRTIHDSLGLPCHHA